MNSKIAFCALGVVQDERTKNISAYNILEEIQVQSFPVVMSQIFFFTLLIKTPDDQEEYDCIFKTFCNGNEIFQFPIHISFQGKLRNRVIITLNHLTIPEVGRLYFKLFYNENILSEYDINVGVIPAAHPEQIPA